MKKSLAILTLFTLITLFSHAEPPTQTVTVTVTGEYTLHETTDETVKNPYLCAKLDAQKKALEQVTGQRIVHYAQSEQSELTGESFYSMTTSGYDGNVVSTEIIDKSIVVSEDNNSVTFRCKARVTIKKGGAKDHSFQVEVSGIKTIYADGDPLSFSFTSTKDCFLNVFIYENSGSASLLFPDEDEKSRSFSKDQKHTLDGWHVEKQSKADSESYTVVFLFTKKEFSLPKGSYNRDDVEKRISRIPADQMCRVNKAFVIQK